MTEAREPVKPEVGMGATIIYFTDRQPATVVAVKRGGRQVVVREDSSTLVGGSSTLVGGSILSESQTYTFEENPNGQEIVFNRNARGQYYTPGKGIRLALGYRTCYRDPSF